jgi:8-oxo-dGTP pyrophosphatase MutT (NUDIX family)
MKKAVCIFMKNDSGDVVLVTRPNSNQVGLPGGKVEEGEDNVTAILRELKEETGIVLDKKDISEVFSSICEGEVDYFTTAYSATFNGDIPGGCEPNVIALYGKEDDLLNNSPFADFNKALIDVL